MILYLPYIDSTSKNEGILLLQSRKDKLKHVMSCIFNKCNTRVGKVDNGEVLRVAKILRYLCTFPLIVL